jgi:[ribosomal protein S18]-alanine N-acetyltransferase
VTSTRIRPATKLDLETIYRIEDESFSDPYPNRLLTKLLRDCPKNFLVAEVDPGAVIGYCVASIHEEISHLISIGVLRQYRRRGVATALMEALLMSLGPEITEVVLEVKQENAEAIRLYEALGFREVNLIQNYYNDGSSAVKMRLSLHEGPQGDALLLGRRAK